MTAPSLSFLDDFFGPAIVKIASTFFPKRAVLEFIGAGGVNVTAADDATGKASQVVIDGSAAASTDAKATTKEALVTAQTTDATPLTAYASAVLTDEAVHTIDVIVIAIKSDGTAAARYKRSYSGRRHGGAWTELAGVTDFATDETSSPWDCTVDVSGNTFRVRVTGAAATTIRWGVAVRIQSTVP